MAWQRPSPLDFTEKRCELIERTWPLRFSMAIDLSQAMKARKKFGVNTGFREPHLNNFIRSFKIPYPFVPLHVPTIAARSAHVERCNQSCIILVCPDFFGQYCSVAHQNVMSVLILQKALCCTIAFICHSTCHTPCYVIRMSNLCDSHRLWRFLSRVNERNTLHVLLSTGRREVYFRKCFGSTRAVVIRSESETMVM